MHLGGKGKIHQAFGILELSSSKIRATETATVQTLAQTATVHPSHSPGELLPTPQPAQREWAPTSAGSNFTLTFAA